MLNLLELEQLVAFADCGRLSKAAEKLNISQPTITRTIQHLEEEFGVPLFDRGKNHIALNETGQRAVEHARALLKSADQAVKDIRRCVPVDRCRDRMRLRSSGAPCGTAPVLDFVIPSDCRTEVGILHQPPPILN